MSGADSTHGTVTLETAAPLKDAYSARIPGVGSSYPIETIALAGGRATPRETHLTVENFKVQGVKTIVRIY